MKRTLKYYFDTLVVGKSTEYAEDITTKNINDSFTYLSERIKQKQRLFFVRFGDGEFMTMLKKDHRNYVYNENLANEIEASFRVNDENYLISTPINYPYDEYHTAGVYKRFPVQQEMIDLMYEKGFDMSRQFENPVIFQCMTVFEPLRFKKMLDEDVRPKTKMFIGSTEKQVAEKLYGKIDYYVKIPAKHAYETINEWWPKIEQNANKAELIIPSAGSSSNVIAIRLWNQNYQGKLIDFGSVVDAVDDKKTRTWIKLRGHQAKKLVGEKLTLQDKLKDVWFVIRRQWR